MTNAGYGALLCRAAAIGWLGFSLAAVTQAATELIPISAGVNFVLAVSNSSGSVPTQSDLTDNTVQGDYETVVTITAVSKEGITQSAYIDGVDASGVRRQGSIPRQVLTADLANSHLQVLGFVSSDPPVINGTTALGPSFSVINELLATGKTDYSFRNYVNRETISGTLVRGEPTEVNFPVLINGKRVELQAIRATGNMTSGSSTRPFEHYILPHRQYPISLRIAYGPRNGAIPFKAAFSRDVVRIDFAGYKASALEQALTDDCSVAVPGIYFNFNEATLQPQSQRALQEIAALLAEHPQRHVSIEGHTDNIGGARYNDDLSTRRAAAVKAALERDFHADGSIISTKGYGEHRPVESNETLAGRARNRRVELVRECVR